MKKPKILKPGLLHGPRRVEVEKVNARMGKMCTDCGDYPEVRRLTVTEGVGRSGKDYIYCLVCGRRWLRIRKKEIICALRYLRTGEGSIRGA